MKLVPPAAIEEPAHAIYGDSAWGSLHSGGGREFLRLRDPLCLGPCDVDPTRHKRKRRAYLLSLAEGYAGPHADWYQDYVNDLARSALAAPDFAAHCAEFDPGKPIVLWTTTSWPDRVVFWWILDCIQRTALDRERFWVCELSLPQRFNPEHFHPPKTLGAFSPEAYQTGFRRLRPLTAKLLKCGARLWQTYAGPSPIEFAKARRRSPRFFPDLPFVTKTFRGFFPQAVGRGRGQLRLSDVDQKILDTLETDRWLRPVDLVKKDFDLFDLCCFSGDWFLNRRLWEWATHKKRTPVLLSREEPGAGSDFMAMSYQLTARGRRLREWGLEASDDAPTLFHGGFQIYATDKTWVRCNRGRQWWIDIWTGPA